MSRGRFEEVIERQLDLFEADQAELIAQCDLAEQAYDASDRAEAEERYSEYLALVELASEALAEMRDAYAGTLDPSAAAAYEEAFNRAVVRRFPRFALELDSD